MYKPLLFSAAWLVVSYPHFKVLCTMPHPHFYLIVQVEVGGWPIPELVWYKDDEPVMTTLHTENYNGFPNKYVPDRRVEVRQIDPIRHCIIFHRISESDAGKKYFGTAEKSKKFPSTFSNPFLR